MGKLTLVDVAKLADVSRSTVSRVLNNHPNVKEEVRKRVWQVIRETGYHPDPAARSLAKQRSGIIGLVIPQKVQSIFTDPYFPSLIQGITKACNNHNYTLSLFLFHSIADEQKLYPKVLRNQLFDGLIITATQLSKPMLDQLLENQVSFVMIGRSPYPNVNFVDTDNLIGAQTAVSHLIRQGYQRIATITGSMNNIAAIDRKQGYINVHEERGRLIDPNLIVEGDFTEISGYECMQRLLPYKPDAVFVASDTMALGALRALHQAGIAVPEDIAVIGFDDLPQSATTIPPLTTIRQPIRQTGIQAVNILLNILDEGPIPAQRIVLTTELVIRESTINLK